MSLAKGAGSDKNISKLINDELVKTAEAWSKNGRSDMFVETVLFEDIIIQRRVVGNI